MRKLIFALVFASAAAPVLAAPPERLMFTDEATQKDIDTYIKCVSETAFSAGLAHKDVPAADVVNAAGTKCPDWQRLDVMLQMQWDTAMIEAGHHTAGPEQAEPIIEKWRDDWFKEIAGQLTAKRLGI